MEEARDRVADSALGDRGRWQIRIVLLTSATKLPVIWALLGIVFLAPPVQFHCGDLHEEGYNITLAAQHSCSSNCTTLVYDRSIFKETIVTQWDLVCGRRQFVNLGQLIFILSVMLGNILISIVSDRVGRKLPIVVTGVVMGLSGLGSAFVQSYYAFIALRLVQGFAVGGNIATAHVMCIESLGAKSRPTLGTMTHMTIYLGTAISALIAYFSRHWRTYQIAVSTPSLLMLSYLWLMGESPRWLMAVGRDQEALDILRRVAKINNNPIPSSLPPPTLSKQERKSYSALDLVKTKRMCLKSLNIWFSFGVVSFCFYGLEQFLTEIGSNMFLNVAVSGFVMLPGVVLSMYTMQRYGRRSTMFASQFLTAVSCLAVVFIPHSMEVVKTVMAILGVTGAAVTFSTVFLFSAELFPTVLRNSGVGLGATSSRIGAMIAPFVVSLDTTWSSLPPLLFSLTSLLASCLVLLLPETLDRRLPVTLEDAENFTRKYKKVKTASPEENPLDNKI